MVTPIFYGVSGAAIVLIAYLLELFKHVSPENTWFLLANTVGSGLLFYYAILLNSTPFMVLNAAWGLGSLFEIWRLRK